MIYIAGPYTAKSEIEKTQNILNAVRAAAFLRSRGCVCVVPHLESMFCETCLEEDEWIRHGLELLKRCDALVTCVLDIQESKGTLKEIEKACKWGIPVFFGAEAYWKNLENVRVLPYFFDSSKK